MSVSTTAPAKERAPQPSPSRARKHSPALLLILPSLIFMLLLFAYPLAQGIITAFSDPSGGFTLGHWERMVGDNKFIPALRNTMLLIVVLIPLQFAFALAMALLLQEKPRLSGMYFYFWAIPLAVSDLAAGLVWLSIFQDRGYLNSVLDGVGLPVVSWLHYENTTTMFIAVLCAELWRATSLVLVIVVSGMQGIPKDYAEAAAVFNANYWKRLRHVILPLLKPSLQVALILRTILAFQTFAVAQALTGENFPLLVGETYRWYNFLTNPYVASAYALLILGISMVTAVVYLRVLRDQSQVGKR